MCDVYQVKYIEKNIERNGVIKAIENEEDVEIAVQLDNVEIVKRSDNFWEALLSVRRELELKEIRLLCKGCCKNVYPSAMMLSMGAGRRAYVLNMGEQAKRESLVDEYSSIAEQQNYYDEWCDSIRG